MPLCRAGISSQSRWESSPTTRTGTVFPRPSLVMNWGTHSSRDGGQRPRTRASYSAHVPSGEGSAPAAGSARRWPSGGQNTGQYVNARAKLVTASANVLDRARSGCLLPRLCPPFARILAVPPPRPARWLRFALPHPTRPTACRDPAGARLPARRTLRRSPGAITMRNPDSAEDLPVGLRVGAFQAELQEDLDGVKLRP